MKTRRVYLIYPFSRRMKLGRSLQTCLSWHFKQEKPFLESIFIAKQELITRTLSFVYKTSRLVRNSLCSGKLFYKSNRKLFFLCLQTLDFVSGLHNCLEFSQPLGCLYQVMQNRKKVFYCLNIAFLEKYCYFAVYKQFICKR